ncbi:paired amphipathic helix protein Sin3 [Trifolium repens]|nr:paired amphipathic helix protein Sin3 [Trifolium repens]
MGGALVLFLCFGVVAGRVALRGVSVVFFVLAFGLVLYPSSVFAPFETLALQFGFVLHMQVHINIDDILIFSHDFAPIRVDQFEILDLDRLSEIFRTMSNLRLGEPSQMKNIRSMEFKDGLEFLKDAKSRFIQENKKDKYDDFDCLKRLKEIFQGHRDLHQRLNEFIPIGYEIELPSKGQQSCQKKHVTMEDAVNFLKKIKTQFQGVEDVHIYYSFLNILIMHYKKHKSFNEVCQEVAFIFKGHPDILDEFTYFLPEAISSHYAQNFVLQDI